MNRNRFCFALPLLIVSIMACFINTGCGDGKAATSTPTPVVPTASPTPTPTPEPTRSYTYKVVNTYPHDIYAFTQGLLISDGEMYESTGQNGLSTLRKVELTTGKVVKKVDVPAQYFAEGLAELKGKLYQLTWQSGVGFIYERDTFKKIGEFRYSGEGWGLTTDGTDLILSDGTNQIRFIDPATFSVKRTISVFGGGLPLDQLNELEYINGEIYANIWKTNSIVKINPQSGKVTGWIDMSNILPEKDRTTQTDVLNGIAFDKEKERLFVTGKRWPKLFEIQLIEQ
jgi:glutamine cyclotransferase